MKKILLRVLIVLVVLVAAAVLVVGLFLDSIVKKGVETVGPQITKVDVKLNSVSLSLFSGSGTIKGLVVGNPEGYKAPQAISIGLASMAVSPGSLLSDKIVVRSLRLESPEITFEGGPVKNNLKQILDNVNASTGGETSSEETKSTKPGKKIEVDDFVITGAKVHVGTGGTTLSLPEIHLTDLGKGSDGITAGDLTKRVLNELISKTLSTVAGSAGHLGKEATKAAESAGKNAAEAVGNATKGLKDLFKKKE